MTEFSDAAIAAYPDHWMQLFNGRKNLADPERAAFDAGREYEAARRDEHDAAASASGDTSWDQAVARAKCDALSAWGGQCCKPSGHRGVHVADLGGTGSVAWGFQGPPAGPGQERTDVGNG